MIPPRAARMSLTLLWLCLFCGCSPAQTQSLPPLDQMTLHVVPQAHIDMAWWWRYDPETIRVIVPKTLAMAFNNLEKYPDYTFSFLQVPAIDPLEKLNPELFYRIHYYLYHSKAMGLSIPNPHGTDPSQGRFKLVHGMYVEVDGCAPSGEAVVRQCLYGKRYFKYKFGIDVNTAWVQDAWTHPWTYPQILQKSGINSYMFKRGRGGESDERMFWWEAADGSRVFAYKPPSFGGVPAKERWERELREVRSRYGVADHIALVGVGDHGGGVPEGDIEAIKKVMSGMPAQAKFSTADQFLKAVLSQKRDFPTVKYEISPTIRGAYTTVGEIKKGNRQSENLLLAAEKFASLAMAMGQHRYPQADFNGAWRKVMLNQFHDTISGTDTPDATDDALRLYEEVLDTAGKHLRKTLKAIASRIDTHGQGIPIVVFNPLSWDRTDLAEAELQLPDGTKAVQLVTPQGRQIPFQVLSDTRREGVRSLRIIFIADGVPSLGYKTYRMIPQAGSSAFTNTLRVSDAGIENEFFKVEIDGLSGCVKNVLDKRQGRNVLDKSGRGNLIQIIDDFGNSEGFLKSADGKLDPAHKWTGKTVDVDSNPEIKVLEQGPVRATIQIKKKSGLSRFTQTVALYPGVPRIDFELTMDWKGHNKMVKVSFPTSVSAPEATYEIPYGTIRRPSRGEEQNAQKWVDVSAQNYGVSLLNESRYGYDVKDNVIRLSVLRSPDSPACATDERGVHTLRYSLYPHAGSWQDAGVTQRGDELNYPFSVITDTVHDGDLPASYSFVQVRPANVIVEAIKKAEDSDNLILRLYETTGKKSSVTISLAQAVDAIHQTDLLENDLEDIPTDGKNFRISLGAHSIETFKLIRDER